MAGLTAFIFVSTTVKTLQWGRSVLFYTPQALEESRGTLIQWNNGPVLVQISDEDAELSGEDDGERELEEDPEIDSEDARLVLTETKVVTVTRTVTKTVTATPTASASDKSSTTMASKVKRSHKGRRSNGK